MFANHIRALTESFDSKLADVGNPLVRQLGRYLSWTRVDAVAWRESQGQQETASHSRSSRLNETLSAPNSREPFGYCEWGFPWFSTVVRQMPGYSIQCRGTSRTPLPCGRRLHLCAGQTSHNSSMRQSQSGLGTQTANQQPNLIPSTSSPGQPRP